MQETASGPQGARGYGLEDSLGLLYRVFCRPTSLAAAGRWPMLARLRFMATTSLVILAANVLLGGVAAKIAQFLGADVHWVPGGALRSLEGLAMGAALGAVWNVAGGVAWAVLWGPTRWILEAIVLPLTPLLPDPMERVPSTQAALGLSAGVALGLGLGSLRGAFWALPLAIAAGLAWPAAYGWSAGWLLAGGALVAGTFWLGYFQLEWYAVDAGATLWQLARARRHPEQAQALLRASPIRWREPIWLPLLGLKSFLHLVDEQDGRAGLEECLFILLERPTQARLARAALLEVVAGHLAARESIPEVASAADRIGWGAAEAARLGAGQAPLPPLLGLVVPRLEELARFAEQHLTATLPHNRRRALERLRDGAQELARGLAVQRGGAARLFIGVARKWRALAEAPLAELGRAEAEAGVVRNPYVFGQPIEETDTNLFVGRRDMVREIEVSLLGGAAKPALVLWGPRRMGKTSVLLQLPRLLGNEFAPAFVELQSMGARESLAAFCHTVTHACAAALQRRRVAAPPHPGRRPLPRGLGALPFPGPRRLA